MLNKTKKLFCFTKEQIKRRKALRNFLLVSVLVLGIIFGSLSVTEVRAFVFGSMQSAPQWIKEDSTIVILRTETNDVRVGSSGTLFVSPTSNEVGVGDITPDGLLDVEFTGAKTADAYALNLSNLTTNTTADGVDKYGIYATSTGDFSGSGGTATNNYGLYIDTVSGADNNYGAYIAGNVGIGDTSPDGFLDVEPTGAVTADSYGLNLSNLTTNADTDAINKYGSYITSTGTFTGSGGAATNNYGLYIDTVSGADNNYGAYIANNAGIGTSSPDELLHIYGDNPRLLVENNDTSGNAIIYLYGDSFSNDAILGSVQGHWAGNVVSRITFRAGDDIGNKDEGAIGFEVSDAGSIPDRRMILTKDGYLQVDERVGHILDTDTYMSFSPDVISFTSGNVELLQLYEGTQDAVVINENSSDVDFRVETNGITNAIFADGANDIVKFGGGVQLITKKVIKSYEMTNADTAIMGYGTLTVTLPPIGYDGKIVIIKNIFTGTVTVDGYSEETIDGAASVTLHQYDSITLIQGKDSSEEWSIVSLHIN